MGQGEARREAMDCAVEQGQEEQDSDDVETQADGGGIALAPLPTVGAPEGDDGDEENAKGDATPEASGARLGGVGWNCFDDKPPRQKTIAMELRGKTPPCSQPTILKAGGVRVKGQCGGGQGACSIQF
ncbi:MAG: hypothetical protein HY318_08695 [Armatimonadetes bacterium]|nr:hypothetical protein [Armatimonadota bacterium]